MIPVLTDIFLMEAYVNEKMQGISFDSLAVIKKTFYKTILAKHKVDSVAFYTTFNYYQSHPKEFVSLLNLVDSSLNKIEPKDTTTVKPFIAVPKNIESLSSFTEQEKVMRDEYLKNLDTLRNQNKFRRQKIRKN